VKVLATNRLSAVRRREKTNRLFIHNTSRPLVLRECIHGLVEYAVVHKGAIFETISSLIYEIGTRGL
jgi:hypothetical protein